MNSLLVFSKDKILFKAIKDRLIYKDFSIEGVNEYKDFEKKLINFPYDFILLDISVDKSNNMEQLYRIRKKTKAYLIVMGENNNIVEKIMSLERGADTYIESPVEIMELKAILNSINRRKKIEFQGLNKSELIVLGDFKLDLLNKKINYLSLDIYLTLKEFQIFYILIKDPDKPYSRDELSSKLGGLEYKKNTRSIDVHIKKIREKLKAVSNKEFIFTRWGEGYYFKH